jgi:hypothetical protein
MQMLITTTGQMLFTLVLFGLVAIAGLANWSNERDCGST